MTEIIPGLWLGKWQNSQDIDFLEEESINCIINCTNSFKFPDINVRKIRVPILDNGKNTEVYKMYCMLDKAVTLIRRLLANRYRILIHCQAGQQRSVAIVLAFIIKYTGMNLIKAQEMLRTKWQDADGTNFFKALEQYESDLNLFHLTS